MIKQIGRTPAGSHFKHPVPVEAIPGYSETVKEPMDFSTIVSKIHQDAYSSLSKLSA